MRISINLATRPFRDFGPMIRNLRIAMGVLVVLSLSFWLGLHLFHAAAEKARARAHSLDGQFANLNAEQQGYQNLMREPDNARVLNQSQMLNQLFEEKAFSWTLAMEDLERVLPGGVQVTTLEPLRDPKTGVITVKLRVLGPRDKSIDLVRNLEHARRFVNARIVDESVETGNNNTQKMEPVSASAKANFNLNAEYSLPNEEESKEIIKNQKKVEEPIAAAPAVTTPMQRMIPDQRPAMPVQRPAMPVQRPPITIQRPNSELNPLRNRNRGVPMDQIPQRQIDPNQPMSPRQHLLQQRSMPSQPQPDPSQNPPGGDQ